MKRSAASAPFKPGLALRALLLSGVLLVAVVLASRLTIEWLWFSEFGAQGMLLRRWLLQIVAFALVMGLGVPLQLQQLQRCWRLRQQSGSKQLPTSPLLRLGPWPLSAVLVALLALLAVGLSFLWVQARGLIAEPFSGQVITGLAGVRDLPLALVLGLAVVLLPALLLAPLISLRIILAAALAASATALARGWSFWLPALLAVPFGKGDPLTGLDISFTVLQLPALRLILSVLCAQAVVGLAGCLWLTLTEGSSLSELRYGGLSRDQQRVLQPQLAVLALVLACSNALAPFDLMVQGSGVASGAGWVDLHVRLPLRLLLAVLLLLCSLALVVPWGRTWLRRGVRLLLAAAALLLPVAELIGAPLLQRLWVQPRELAVETPYLRRSIEATRDAFGLSAVKETKLDPKQRLSAADLRLAQGTVASIRLWDSQPLLATNRQLQQLRLYYRFASAAVDRYALRGESAPAGAQQVLIAARELDTGGLPKGSATWLNRHLVFTHGYGFTVSSVNAAGPDGLPLYFVKDLGRAGQVRGIPQLGIETARVKTMLPLGRPRLYFSSAQAPYAIAPTLVREFDFPDGDLNVYTHYDGKAGIAVGSLPLRLMASLYLHEPRLLSSGSLTSGSRLLIRRQVNQRLASLLPFLRFESQPYLVTVRITDQPGYSPGQHQYWMLDGFTTSSSYPYSDANKAGIRYFRNPVKAVVDAYGGRVWLYVSDPSDPILRTWQRAFPDLFEPLSAMPRELQAHIQVPQSQFSIQAERLLRYHVTDVRTFYNGDDVWSIPLEIYGESNVPVRPYHVTIQLPGQSRPEFVLLLPFAPLKRSNMVGWLAARNDQPHYGQLQLVRFPQQRLLLGPQQVSALIEQDPVISYQFGLWNRVGSRLVHGNLLVLPVGNGILYVEPIYLQSRNNDIPTLARVVVTDGVTFVMERDLKRALEVLVSRSAAAGAPPPGPGSDPEALPQRPQG
ncbi:MAG: UPF0182 family protein [Cyanobacteria bacterium K_DeepCast_35m_m2_155]|nr:UPF0182 family protein [Cyanobacteria bacterium K_DeepCast_35m_m2_155]